MRGGAEQTVLDMYVGWWSRAKREIKKYRRYFLYDLGWSPRKFCKTKSTEGTFCSILGGHLENFAKQKVLMVSFFMILSAKLTLF